MSLYFLICDQTSTFSSLPWQTKSKQCLRNIKTHCRFHELCSTLTPNTLNCKVDCDEHILHKIIMLVSVHISKQFCGGWSTMTTICSTLHQIDFQVHLTAGSFILQLYTSSFKQTRATNQRNNSQNTLGNLIRRYLYFLGVQPSMWCTTRRSFFHLLVWWACVKDTYIKNPKVCRAGHKTESTELTPQNPLKDCHYLQSWDDWYTIWPHKPVNCFHSGALLPTSQHWQNWVHQQTNTGNRNQIPLQLELFPCPSIKAICDEQALHSVTHRKCEIQRPSKAFPRMSISLTDAAACV